MALVQFGPLVEALDPVLHVLMLFGMMVLLIEAAVLLGSLIGVDGHSRDGS